MKIGILTLPFHYNYGGILQAYALQKVLEELGHEVFIINYPFTLREPSRKVLIKRFLKHILGKNKGYYINFEKKYNTWLPIMKSKTDLFIRDYLKMSKPLNSYYEIKELDYDAIVVGSDQIWRPCMFQQDPAIAFLSFTKKWNIKRLSYAASFGTDVWEYDDTQTEICRCLAKLFDAISVRETSGIQLCTDKLKIKAVQVCDPTLLINAETYIKLFETKNIPKSKGSLFDYTLDDSDNIKTLINYVVLKKKLIPFKVNANDMNVKCPIEDRIAQPVEVWLRAFYDAEFIVTDSFHACVFSILFRKQFVVVANKRRGLSRFETLLGSFGLLDRMIETPDDYEKMSKTIDYGFVYDKLNTEREKSICFLKRYL